MKDQQEVGFVQSVRDFILRVNGLPSVKINEIVKNSDGARAMVASLDDGSCEVLLLDRATIRPGDTFYKTGEDLAVPLTQNLLGRAINPLGVPIDGKGLIKSDKQNNNEGLESAAKNIGQRQFIDRQLETGVTLVDLLFPIGKGQRELVIGDARAGKASFLLDVVTNQRRTGVICIYVMIGKPLPEVQSVIDSLNEEKDLDYTVVISASSADMPPLVLLSIPAAFTVAEYFQMQGKDVLVILDDMGMHAKIYREIGLLAARPPGRESYPGDIFYQHAHLLERGGNFTGAAGGGSITVLPTIELDSSDYATLIPTNLMGMTDGHLLFKASLASQGMRPAVDTAFSVTRVGRQTQNRIQSVISSKIRQVLGQATQLETLSRFSFELPPETQMIFKQNGFIKELLKQPPLYYFPRDFQVMMVSLAFTKWLSLKDAEFLTSNKEKIIDLMFNLLDFKNLLEKIPTMQSEKELFEALEPLTMELETGLSNNKNGQPTTT